MNIFYRCTDFLLCQPFTALFKHNTSKFLEYHRKQSNERQRFNKRKKSDSENDSGNDFTESKIPSKVQNITVKYTPKCLNTSLINYILFTVYRGVNRYKFIE